MNDDIHLKQVYFHYDGSPWRPNPEEIFGDYLDRVLRCLEGVMGNRYWHYSFVVYYHNIYQPLPEFPISGESVILIFLADEKSTVPVEIADKFFAIFKAYYPFENNLRNIVSFPIGYSNSAQMSEFRPFSTRTFDASYAGNFLANRLDFFRQFTWLKWFPPFPVTSPFLKNLYWRALVKLKIYRPRVFKDALGKSMCYWSGGFAKGLSRQEYANVISDTKIALCPKGFISTECFRLFETMRLGCIIIADVLPPTRWYKGSPIIILEDWLHVKNVVNGLLNDPVRMEALHAQTLDWWETRCSDEAVANYLADEIRRLEVTAGSRVPIT